MIVVDSSVWIDFLNEIPSPQAILLDRLLGRPDLMVADLIRCEVLQGLRNEREAALVAQKLDQFHHIEVGGRLLATAAAANYRRLRALGITIRKTIDLLVGTWCIEHSASILHRDRDYEPMCRHLGLLSLDVGPGPN